MKKAKYVEDTPWVKHKNIQITAHTAYDYCFYQKGSKAYLGMISINFRQYLSGGWREQENWLYLKCLISLKRKRKKSEVNVTKILAFV